MNRRSIVAIVFAVVWLCPHSSLRAAEVYLRQEADALRFGNGIVELVLNGKSGFFRQIRNLATGIEHKPAEDGVWPFGLWVGSREQPEQMKAEIRSDGVQQMTHKLQDQPNDAKQLFLTYSMLADNKTRAATGVGLGVWIELAPQRDYFVLHAQIANSGPLGVTRFHAGYGALLTGDNGRTKETIYVPTRGGQSRENFKGARYGLPTYAWGWMDYSGQKNGIGIGYVNKQGIQLVTELASAGDGLQMGWCLFDTRGYWHFESLYNDFQKSLRIQPLEAASTFTTDEWLIIPHAGDWHRTADVYRERYETVFKDDYLDWKHLPDRVKTLYMQLGFHVAENSIGNAYPRKVITPLALIAPQIETVIKQTGVEPGHVSVNVAFSQPQVGCYPQFFPVYEPAGGENGWQELLRRLREIGVGYVIAYTHLAYNHHAAANYVPEADTAGTIPATINPTAGDRACVDNAAWVRLWRDELVPAYKAHSLNGVYADEGHFPWGICCATGPAHLHGPSAVGILTSGVRGVMRLHKLFHDQLGPDSVIMVEGASDVGGRWVEANHAYPDPSVAYTLPFKRYLWNLDVQTPEPTLSENINVCLTHGYAIMFNCHQDHPVTDWAPVRRYVDFRRQLESQKAPGYPQGFRDTVGVTTSSPTLVARAFTDADGISIVHYARTDTSGEITVNGSELGHPDLGVQKRHITLAKDEIGLLILK